MVELRRTLFIIVMHIHSEGYTELPQIGEAYFLVPCFKRTRNYRKKEPCQYDDDADNAHQFYESESLSVQWTRITIPSHRGDPLSFLLPRAGQQLNLAVPRIETPLGLNPWDHTM